MIIIAFKRQKINKDVDKIAKQLCASRWMRCGYIEADGSGGILIMWDLRIWVAVVQRKANSQLHTNSKLSKIGFADFSRVCMLYILELKNQNARKKLLLKNQMQASTHPRRTNIVCDIVVDIPTPQDHRPKILEFVISSIFCVSFI